MLSGILPNTIQLKNENIGDEQSFTGFMPACIVVSDKNVTKKGQG